MQYANYHMLDVNGMAINRAFSEGGSTITSASPPSKPTGRCGLGLTLGTIFRSLSFLLPFGSMPFGSLQLLNSTHCVE